VFDRICSWSNLLLAYRRASRGKRGHDAVAAFEHRLEERLIALRQDLVSGSYRPGRYCSFCIHEPKRRLISAAPFRDRVVHHALCNVVEPLFDRSFVAGSFANRKQKGTHRALAYAQHCARRHRYVLQCDVKQFFPSIDHAILTTTLRAKIDDPRVMDLVALILASGKGVHDACLATTPYACERDGHGNRSAVSTAALDEREPSVAMRTLNVFLRPIVLPPVSGVRGDHCAAR
jgi:retron-type reverse transcriptase